jgi:hypothetical protein
MQEKLNLDTEQSPLEKMAAELNKKSIQETGRPAVVCKRIDSQMLESLSDSLTAEEIAELESLEINTLVVK